jgi:hypothetical protein
VERTAPALEDPAPLWTELGEMEEERGRPEQAMALWRNLLAREPRDPTKVADLATLLWDYGHDREALEVVEAGRKAMGKPRFYPFEAGVLRENLRDLDGAVREYLDAVRPEDPDSFSSWFYQDQRSLRRLAQLLARERVFRTVADRIQRLAPGDAEAERELAAFFPLGGINQPDQVWDADAWIDQIDQPSDPLGRAARQADRAAQRPAQTDAIRRMGDLLLAKTLELVPMATSQKFLDFASGEEDFARGRWSADQVVAFQDRVMARKAELAPSDEERVGQEIARAQFLAAHGRVADADAVWAGLGPRIGQLPEGTVRIEAEARRAGYLERAKGVPAAAGEWRRLTASYPWSLGLLEDRLSFLARAGLAEEGRDLLEQAAAKAGSGYKEDLLRRLAQASLDASDLPRARRAAERLLAQEALPDDDRLAAARMLARLSFRGDPGWDPFALVRAQEPGLKPERRADLYHELAQAADLERAPALALWIEALNRRTEPAWLAQAARSAANAAKGQELLAFFQRQRERSPRDVRWVVAVRDIRRCFHDVPGAIEAAEAAVKVRPDDEGLWRAAADILVRADRVREAADFLAEWNRPRPADEYVARWRAGLYAQGGDASKALAVEQAALAAFAREAPGKRDELAERKARAADRMIDLGLPDLALCLLSPKRDAADLARTKVPLRRQAELALVTGQFQRLLETRAGDGEFLAAAGAVLAELGRPEHREAVQSLLVQILLPPGGRPDSAALARWWPFIGASGLEPALRAALAQCLLESRPGPWQADPGFPLVERVGTELIQSGQGDSPVMVFREPDLSRLWCWDLARRERDGDLLSFTEPRWRELMAQVKGAAPVPADQEPLPWASWLQDPAVLQAWARAAAARPGMVRELAEVMGERRLWDRFWALAARRWAPQPLVAALPEQARTDWFRFWEPALAPDPVLGERRRTVERVSLALARLLQGDPGAAEDPLVAKLRGPRTVGGVLGRDAQWTWPEFSLRRDAQGRPMEQGDDLALGQGADQGRLPGALWGERPGEAWYVLETLARYRQGEPDAPRLPLVTPRKGAETPRAILAVRLARAMNDLPLALDLAGANPGAAGDRAWLEAKLALLVAADREPEAAGAFKAYVQAAQSALTEAGFKDLSALAGRLGLPSPMVCLDPEQPVGPVFLAYLQDARPAAAARFRTADPTSFRLALANRWHGNEARLSPQQLRTWLRELWARDAAGLPQAGLTKLGPVWSHAAVWLQTLAPPERAAALEALDQALDRAVAEPSLLARLTAPGRPDGWRLLALRIRLSRGETGQVLELVDTKLADLCQGKGLTWDAAAPGPDPDDPAADRPAGNLLVTTLQAWSEPFRAVPNGQAVPERFRAFLDQRRREGVASSDEWPLAFRLCPRAQVPDLLGQLEQAWFRGDFGSGELPGLLPALAAAAPSAAPAWLARCPIDFSWRGTRMKATLLLGLKGPAQAGLALSEARRRALWPAKEEVLAFDLWRKWAVPAATPPSYWDGARAVWAGASLEARLKAHPQDILSARSALASLAPLAEDGAGRAALILRQDGSGDDQTVLGLRAARWLLSRSPGAARTALGYADPGELARMLAARPFLSREIDAALADLARAAARTGDQAGVQAVLAALAERGALNLKALAAELPAPGPAQAEPFRLVDGKPAPIRPRDLTWAMLVHVLDLERAP